MASRYLPAKPPGKAASLAANERTPNVPSGRKPQGRVPLPPSLGGPGGIKPPAAAPAAKPPVTPPNRPPQTRTVTVKQHTRRIAVKKPPQAAVTPSKATPGPRGATVTVARQDTSKPLPRRYKPAYPGEKPAGYEPVPQYGKFGKPLGPMQRPYYQVKPDARSGVERAVDRQVTPLLAKGSKFASPALTVPASVAGNALAQLGGGPALVSAAEAARKQHYLAAGVEAAGLLPLGRLGRAIKGAKAGEEAANAAKIAEDAAKPLAARDQLREGLKGARSQYGKEKAARKIEEAARAEHAAEALRTISDPDAALAASGAALRGKYATIDYKGLKELSPATVKQLMSVAQNHPTLGFHDKRTVMQALRAAVDEGRVPRPAELRKIEMVFGKKTAAGMVRQAKQTLGDKILNVLNIPRALQTTADISGLFRQNLVGGVSHPIIWGKSVPRTFKGMTAAGFEAEQQAIKDNPLYHMALQDGVQFTDTGEHATMALHEEGFQSDLAANALDKIPKVPNVIKGSARAYATTGNYMRMSLYENRIRIATAAKDPTIHDPKVRKQIADVINAATGRGTLPGRADHLLPAMNTFLYSPRLMLARLHYMDPTWYFRLKGPARREALRGLFALTGSVTGSLYLFSRIPGVKVDWQHPQSSDWGKLKIGNMRIDIAGGFQQYVRLAAELAPAALGGDRTYSTNTGQYTKLGSGYGKPTRLDVGLKFVENKLSPVPGAVANVARGKDQAGNNVTWQGMAGNYLTPLGFQDAYSAFHDKGGGLKGVEWAAGAYGLSALGLGIQDYPAKQPKSRGGSSGSLYLPGSSSGNGSVYLP